MSRLLQNLDQSVTVADDGRSAIESILEKQPQVVFLDLQMPGMSGYEVAREIRSRVELNHVVLVALSGNADADSRRLAAESGFDQYLVKPTSKAELSRTLHRIEELSTC
jgi:CheY-like chemotaxis protein